MKAAKISPQLRIPAVYARGGTSKGVFFLQRDLPPVCQHAGAARDALLLRVLGSPDPYGKQMDGLGNASSSTSKAVILSASQQAGHDVDYLFGQVSVDRPLIDWSGNCGNLTSAVGLLAIEWGLVDRARIPQDGFCTVRIWQANIGKTILAQVPICAGQVQEMGDFELDGIAFPAAEVQLEFLDPGEEGDGDGDGALLPTGQVLDTLTVPGFAPLPVTLINAGIPTAFFRAADLGLTGTELPLSFNAQQALLERLETLRAHAALRMGLIRNVSEARTRQHTPKIAWVAPPQGSTTSNGKQLAAGDVDVLVRALSMGQLHHAMMGTASVAIAAAAAIPGTLVQEAVGSLKQDLRFGHPSGTLRVGAVAQRQADQWTITAARMSRSARILMEGWVRVPADAFNTH
jgi:2-methylaconitate isomerase